MHIRAHLHRVPIGDQHLGHRRAQRRQLFDWLLDNGQPLDRHIAHLAQPGAVASHKAQSVSTAQHSTAQHRTGQDRTGQHSAAQHSTAQHSTAHHCTAHHSTAQHGTSQHARLHVHMTLFSKSKCKVCVSYRVRGSPKFFIDFECFSDRIEPLECLRRFSFEK